MAICQHEGNNHSTDYFSVYTGNTEPKTLCGYHATSFWLDRGFSDPKFTPTK